MAAPALLRTIFTSYLSDRAREDNAYQLRWQRDPLSHPVLRQMTKQDLADLPFDPQRIDPE